mmetsp:Transcript_7369/g.18499  ORF Transcript_7369/g.18499 Transcript_7369/m.18499 type:complete len:388 (-) Transcript_7369:35-1198(-)
MGVASGRFVSDASMYDVYEVGGKIGHGTFGAVYACWLRDAEEEHREELAVKIVDLQSSAAIAAEAHQSAYDELVILRRIKHPNIVELKDIFEEKNFLYVVMERLLGGELFQVFCDKNSVVLESDIARVGLQVLRALQYLHGTGIVHRDVKPQNVLLASPSPQHARTLESAEIKLIDFGLAHKFETGCVCGAEPQMNLVCGTPAMCAPEIWALQDTDKAQAWKRLYGESYGPKVDVWATGVVLYMALLGRHPFAEREVCKLMTKVCDPKGLPNYQAKNAAYQVTAGCKRFLAGLLEKSQRLRPTASAALKDSWLTSCLGRRGSCRTRSLNLTPVPFEVRLDALGEATAAVAQKWPSEEDLEALPELSGSEYEDDGDWSDAEGLWWGCG